MIQETKIFEAGTPQRLEAISKVVSSETGTKLLSGIKNPEPNSEVFENIVEFFRTIAREDLTNGQRDFAWTDEKGPWKHSLETAYLAIHIADFLNSTGIFQVNVYKVGIGGLLHDAARVLVEESSSHRVIHNDKVNILLLRKMGVPDDYSSKVIHSVDWLLDNKDELFDESDWDAPQINISESLETGKITVEQLVLKLADTLSKGTSEELLSHYNDWLNKTIKAIDQRGEKIFQTERRFRDNSASYSARDMVFIKAVSDWFNSIEADEPVSFVTNERKIISETLAVFDWSKEKSLLFIQ